MEYFFSAIVGYLLGSIPAAYLVMKKMRGIDITATGTGNVGAMNSFEVSNSKTIGALVLLIDALKGLLCVYLVLLFFPLNFGLPGLSLLFAILSHCYNPWLGFKGGRGLATAAGGVILIFPYLLLLWILIWVISYLIKKDILLSNILATILSLLFVLYSPYIAIKYTFPRAESISILAMFVSAVLILILTRHVEPLKELINKKSVKTDKSGK